VEVEVVVQVLLEETQQMLKVEMVELAQQMI
jgi:hypothetical protein